MKALMRSFDIKLFNKVIESALLLQEVFSGGRHGFFFECKMHSLVTTILFRMTGLDSFEMNSKPQPPDGEFGEAKEREACSEWDTIIGSNGLRDAVLLENSFKDTKGHVLSIRL